MRMRSNRFAPWLLLGCLLLVASCGSEKAAPASGPVGHVVVVKGEVRAQRADNEARLVQVDDTVFADDTIVTGDAASVQILIKHNGALWELGQNTSRRIDKGVAFRATTKGAAPLDRKEAVATAAAGSNTTREAGASVSTILAEEDDVSDAPLDGSGEKNSGLRADGLAETKMPKRNRGAQGRKSNNAPPPSPAPSPAKPALFVAPPSPAAPSEKSTSGRSSRRDSRETEIAETEIVEAPSEMDFDDTDEAPSSASAMAKRKESPGAEQRTYLLALVRQCQTTHPGKGTLRYSRKANGQLQVSSSDKSLKALVSCVAKAVRSKSPPNKTAVSGSLQLP